jgi:hypothetical protein
MAKLFNPKLSFTPPYTTMDNGLNMLLKKKVDPLVPLMNDEQRLALRTEQTPSALPLPTPAPVSVSSKPLDALSNTRYIDNSSEVLANNTTKPVVPGDKKGIYGLSKWANIATGVNTALNIATDLIGVNRASDYKPAFVPYQAPIEATHVSLMDAEQKQAMTDSMNSQLSGAREANRRFGLVDPSLATKGIYGANQISSEISKIKNQETQINAQTDNQTGAINAQSLAQRNAANTSIQNEADRFKSGVIGQGISQIKNDLTSGLKSIIDNASISAVKNQSIEDDTVASLENQLATEDNPVRRKVIYDNLTKAKASQQSFYKRTWGGRK